MSAHPTPTIGEATVWLARVLRWRAGGSIRKRLARWAVGPRWFTLPIYSVLAYLALYVPLLGPHALALLAMLTVLMWLVLLLGGVREWRSFILMPAWGAAICAITLPFGLIAAVLVLLVPEVTTALGCAAIRAFVETSLDAGEVDRGRGVATYVLSTVLWGGATAVVGGPSAAIGMVLGHAVLYPIFRADNWLWWYELAMSALVGALLWLAPAGRAYWLRRLPVHTASPQLQPPLPCYGACLRRLARIDAPLAAAAVAASFRAGVRVREAEAAVFADQLTTLERDAAGLRAEPPRRPSRSFGCLALAHPLAPLFAAHDAWVGEPSLARQQGALTGLHEYDVDDALADRPWWQRRRVGRIADAYRDLLAGLPARASAYRRAP